MTVHAKTILCRQREIRAMISHIEKRKSLHIYGTEGSGKTALLDWLYRNWETLGTSLVPIYCRSSRTFRSVLLNIATHLLGHFKHTESLDTFRRFHGIKCGTDLKKLTIRALDKMIFTHIS